MAGVRLHHPNAAFAGCAYVVELDVGYANGQPRECPRCSRADHPVSHARKAVHLALDETGHVIVSREIYHQLESVFLAGMVYVNEVSDPPPQLVGAIASPTAEIISHPLNEADASRHYVPGLTKYQSRDRLHDAITKRGEP